MNVMKMEDNVKGYWRELGGIKKARKIRAKVFIVNQVYY